MIFTKRVISLYLSSLIFLLTTLIPIQIVAAPTPSTWNFNYEGIGNSYKEWTCPADGVYRFETWGASGGGANGTNTDWNGSYATMMLNCFKGEKYYIYCGQHGEYDNVSVNPRTYGDGGAGIRDQFGNYNGSGGGATSIRTKGGPIEKTYDYQILTAGGGGGKNSINNSWVDLPHFSQPAQGFGGAGRSSGFVFIYDDKSPSAGNYKNSYRLFPAEGGGSNYSGVDINNSNLGSNTGVPVLLAKSGSCYIETGRSLGHTETYFTHYGHGKASISYVKDIESRLTYDTDNGSLSGSLTSTYAYNSKVTLPEATKPGYKFMYYTDDTSADETIYYAGDELTVKGDDIILLAHYVQDGIPTFYSRENVSNMDTSKENEYFIHVNNLDDNKQKYIKFLVSEDGGSTFNEINESGYKTDGSSNTVSFDYKGRTEEYVVKNTGYYKLSAWGANGGSSYSNQAYGSQTGGKGHYISGTAFLRRGETLYVSVGQAGTNGYYDGATSIWGKAFGGGGAAARQTQQNGANYGGWQGSAGGGGGATTFSLGSATADRILVAGGGAGASTFSWSYETYMGGGYSSYQWDRLKSRPNLIDIKYQGGASTELGDDGGGEKYGLTADRRIAGGGGGGWHGGLNFLNGSNGAMASRVSSVTTSASQVEWSNGTGNTTYDTTYNQDDFLYAATANGRATLEYIGASTNIDILDADFPIYPYDKLAPNPVNEVDFEKVSSKINILWDQVADNGDIYVYKAQLYDETTDKKLYDCEDANNPGSKSININSTTGTKGYYYYIDNDATTVQMKDGIKAKLKYGLEAVGTDIVAGKDVKYVGGDIRQVSLPVPTTTTYIHITPIDYAENVGETTTFEIKTPAVINYYGNQADSGNINPQIFGKGSVNVKDNTTDTDIDDFEFVKNGYVFAGWNTNANGQGTSYPVGKEVSFDTLKAAGGTLNLYAQWKKVKNVTLTLLDRDTRQPIPYTTFDLYRKEGGNWNSINENLFTNAEGKTRVTNLSESDYKFIQTTTVDDYMYDDEETPFTISLTDNNEEEVEVLNYLLGSITIKLFDTDGTTPLSGAEFTITGTSEVKTTDAFGQIVLTDVKQGGYTVTNKTPKQGYILAGNSVQNTNITIDNLDVELIFYNEKIRDVAFKKVDMTTGEPLSGAIFTLSNADTSIDSTSAADGSVSFNNVKVGTYSLIEKEAPDGYIKSTLGVTVTVPKDGNVLFNGNPDFKFPNNKIVSVSGSKTWDDNNYLNRPTEITVRLKANNKEAVDKNGNPVAAKTVSADTNWQYTFTDLPECDENGKITYTVQEDVIPMFENGDQYAVVYPAGTNDIVNTIVLEPLYTVIYKPGNGAFGDSSAFRNIRKNTLLSTKTVYSLGYYKPNYHFLYWQAEGLGNTSYNEAAEFSMPQNDVVFTAIWEIDKYSVTYEPGDGEGDSFSIPNLGYGSDVPVLGNDTTGYTYAHHKFVKWQIKGTNTYNYPDDVLNITGDVTVVAIWEPLYSIKYVAGEGDGEPYVIPDKESGTIISVIGNDITNYERKGYRFSHWETESGTRFIPEDEFTLTEDVLLIAKYERIPYTVTYKSGELKIPDVIEADIFMDDTVKIKDPKDIKFISKNYVFIGWESEEIADPTVGKNFSMPANNVVFTAKWAKVENIDGNQKEDETPTPTPKPTQSPKPTDNPRQEEPVATPEVQPQPVLLLPQTGVPYFIIGDVLIMSIAALFILFIKRSFYEKKD